MILPKLGDLPPPPGVPGKALSCQAEQEDRSRLALPVCQLHAVLWHHLTVTAQGTQTVQMVTDDYHVTVTVSCTGDKHNHLHCWRACSYSFSHHIYPMAIIPWPLILSYLSDSLYIHASFTLYSILLHVYYTAWQALTALYMCRLSPHKVRYIPNVHTLQ